MFNISGPFSKERERRSVESTAIFFSIHSICFLLKSRLNSGAGQNRNQPAGCSAALGGRMSLSTALTWPESTFPWGQADSSFTLSSLSLVLLPLQEGLTFLVENTQFWHSNFKASRCPCPVAFPGNTQRPLDPQPWATTAQGANTKVAQAPIWCLGTHILEPLVTSLPWAHTKAENHFLKHIFSLVFSLQHQYFKPCYSHRSGCSAPDAAIDIRRRRTQQPPREGICSLLKGTLGIIMPAKCAQKSSVIAMVIISHVWDFSRLKYNYS